MSRHQRCQAVGLVSELHAADWSMAVGDQVQCVLLVHDRKVRHDFDPRNHPTEVARREREAAEASARELAAA